MTPNKDIVDSLYNYGITQHMEDDLMQIVYDLTDSQYGHKWPDKTKLMSMRNTVVEQWVDYELKHGMYDVKGVFRELTADSLWDVLLEQDALELGSVHDMTVQAMRWMGEAVYENAVDVALDVHEDEMFTPDTAA